MTSWRRCIIDFQQTLPQILYKKTSTLIWYIIALFTVLHWYASSRATDCCEKLMHYSCHHLMWHFLLFSLLALIMIFLKRHQLCFNLCGSSTGAHRVLSCHIKLKFYAVTSNWDPNCAFVAGRATDAHWNLFELGMLHWTWCLGLRFRCVRGYVKMNFTPPVV